MRFFIDCSSYRQFHCPSRSEWRIRAKWNCNGSSSSIYSCLFNVFNNKYEEACKYKQDILNPGKSLYKKERIFCFSILYIIHFRKHVPLCIQTVNHAKDLVYVDPNCVVGYKCIAFQALEIKKVFIVIY